MTMQITINVNGTDHAVEVEPRRLLVDTIRTDLGLTGTHIGCDTTSCGACTVLVDGTPVKSCTMFAVQANGSSVTTVEGLKQGAELSNGPEGVPHRARPAVRVLHARDDAGLHRAAWRRTPTPPRMRYAGRSRATSVGAPDM